VHDDAVGLGGRRRAASGFGILVFRQDSVAGADVGGVIYDGTYSEDTASGEISFKVKMAAPAGITPVQTGIATTAPMEGRKWQTAPSQAEQSRAEQSGAEQSGARQISAAPVSDQRAGATDAGRRRACIRAANRLPVTKA
jgi:hypothetical protein